MASLAGILKQMGYWVTGSDQNVYPPMSTQLERLDIPIQQGFKAENLQPRPDLVIVGNVVSRSNPEAAALLASDIPFTSLPKALGEFVIAQRECFVVAGTHGKTTTTALLTWLTDALDMRPGFLVGGIPVNYGLSFRAPEGDCFVIEGDEYDTAFFDKVPKFVHYRPKHVILTSIEFDHADIYRDLAHVKQAFTQLLQLIPEDGTLVYYADDANIVELLPQCRARRRVGYGQVHGEFRLGERHLVNNQNHVGVRCGSAPGKIMPLEMNLQLFGPHNSLNALAVLALAETLNWQRSKVLEAMASFRGVKRRQEILGESHGITVIEDFAHHPTAVALTLDGMRERYPGRRLVAAFEPRSATSRRRVFQKDYVTAFLHADSVFLAQPFDQTKIDESERFSSNELAQELAQHGMQATTASTVPDLVNQLVAYLKPGDVVIIMSNGGFDGIYHKLLTGLQK